MKRWLGEYDGSSICWRTGHYHSDAFRTVCWAYFIKYYIDGNAWVKCMYALRMHAEDVIDMLLRSHFMLHWSHLSGSSALCCIVCWLQLQPWLMVCANKHVL